MKSTINNQLFKKTIIIFWTLWWLIASWTDIVGGLAHLAIINSSFAPDTNYPALVSSLQMYHVPAWLPAILFIGIIAWSLISTGLFFWASVAITRDKEIWMHRAKVAFIISLCYWMAFFLADQIVMKFDLEENHMVQGGFQLMTFLAMYILPD